MGHVQSERNAAKTGIMHGVRITSAKLLSTHGTLLISDHLKDAARLSLGRGGNPKAGIYTWNDDGM